MNRKFSRPYPPVKSAAFFLNPAAVMVILLLVFCLPAFSQGRLSGSVTGKVTDSLSRKPLDLVSLSIKNTETAFVVTTSASDRDGTFTLTNIPVGKYELWLSYVGYKIRKIPFEISEKQVRLDLGTIALSEGIALTEVVIEGEVAPVTVKRDTIEYNAASFKTQQNDNTEELLKKIPGIEVDKDGNIRSGGKAVSKVLVEGKEFFGNDPKAATRNLPADAIKKVQVVDDKTENSKNTGIDDGQRDKVINLTLKEDKKKGWFGNAAMAGGSKERYLAQMNANHFNKDKQVSFLLLSNNVNQSGFSWDDLQNFSGGNIDNAFGSSDGSIRINVNRNGAADINGVFAGVGNGGLIRTHSGGINFSDNYGAKKQLKLNTSYVAILSSNRISRLSDIQDPLANELIYTSQSALGENRNDIHRVNLGLDYKPDSLTRLQFKPAFSYNHKTALSSQTFSSVNQAAAPVNSGSQFFDQENNLAALAGQFTVNRLLREGKGSINLTANGNYNSSSLDYINRSLTRYRVSGTEQQNAFDQSSDQETQRSFINSSLSLVRLISKAKKVNLTLRNTYQYSDDIANQLTLEYNPVTARYETLVPSLSNNFTNRNWRNTMSAGINTSGREITFNINAAAAYLGLSGRTRGNNLADISRSEFAFVPNASISYRKKSGRSMFLSVNSTVNMPDVSDLQPVFNNTNPLYIRNGNPDLEMSRSVGGYYNYTFFDIKSNRYIQLYTGFTRTWNGFSTASVVDPDSRIQTVTPVNADGNYNFNFGLSAGQPAKLKGLRYRVNSNMSNNRNVSYINSRENKADRLSITLGTGLTFARDRFNVDLDFSPSYNNVRNSVQSLSNQEYFLFNNYLNIGGEPVKTYRIFVNISQTSYSGANSAALNNDFLLLNAGIEKFFMKDRRLTLSLNMFDLLNQNSNLQRSVTNTGRIEDFRTNNLNRYGYLKLNYKLQRVGGAKPGGVTIIR